MKTVLRDMGIIVVFACFVLLLALFYKGKYVQAENKNAAKAEASTLDVSSASSEIGITSSL